MTAESAPAGAAAPAAGEAPTNGAAPAPTLIDIKNLVKYYPIHGGILRRKVGDVKAVDDVSFEVRRGEVFGLVGESGCGKSTLGKTLIRLQPPTAGTASIEGEPIFDKKGADLKRLRRRMQIIFQDPVGSLNPRMPISDIIGEGLLAQADKENGSRTTSRRSGCGAILPGATRTSSAAASASGSGSPGRSRSTPTSSCATSRSPRSTCRSRARSSTCSSTCAASST
jgi:ABC-type glutathione transport system ATPase component